MPAEPFVFAVACEDRGHFEAISRLTDHRIAEVVPWTADILEHVRIWAKNGESKWWSITAARSAASDLGMRVHGHFGGVVGGPEAKRCREQLLLWMRLHRGEKIHVAILMRDLDRRDDRLEEMMLAIRSGTWPFTVLAVWCQPEVEGWAVGCFEPGDDAEHQRLDAIRRRLSFCPVTEPDRMTSAVRDPERDAKKIAAELFAGDEERRQRWFDLPFDTLRARGVKTGLADFLSQVDEKIVRLFQTSPSRESAKI